jgi:hypothetical protein
VDMTSIKKGKTLTKDECRKEADEMTLSTTEVMQSVKLIHYDKDGKLQPAASVRLN